MTYSSFRSHGSFFFTLSLTAGLLAGTACGGEGGGGADAGRRDTGAPGLDGSLGDAACIVECAAPPTGCHWQMIPGECACGTLICEDAGAVADDAYVPPGTDAAVEVDAYVPPGTDAAVASTPDAYVPPGTDAGRFCSSSRDCGRGQYCMTATCGGTGACTTMPAACTREYVPVCGCDGMTYGNACMAQMAGQSVASAGECPTTGGCADNTECNRVDYCAGTGCGTPGTCEVRPEICSSLYAPVCGCDGNTYSNSCMAAAAGVRVESTGECATTGPVCMPPCVRGQYCALCRGSGGPVSVCLPVGTAC